MTISLHSDVLLGNLGSPHSHGIDMVSICFWVGGTPPDGSTPLSRAMNPTTQEKLLRNGLRNVSAQDHDLVPTLI